MKHKFLAESIGTMVLVLMGCGTAVFNGGATSTAAVLTIAFAFGLSVVAMAYVIGPISGCHINPAVTLGFWLSGRMQRNEALAYMAAQVTGALAGSALLWLLVNGGHAATGATTTGANTYAEGNLVPALIAETLFTAVFVLVVLGATASGRSAPDSSYHLTVGREGENVYLHYSSDRTILAGLVIGLTLVLVHIVCIPITGTSVNPARSLAPALFEGGAALEQLWVFFAAPFAGAALAAGVWKALTRKTNRREE